MRRSPNIRTLVCLFLAVATLSCGGHTGDQLPAPTGIETTAKPGNDPGLPALPDLNRITGQSAGNVRQGMEFEVQLPNSNVSGSDEGGLDFMPSSDTGLPTAFAIYAFNQPPVDGTASLLLDWEPTGPASEVTYIAVADFSSGRWQWQQATGGNLCSFGTAGKANPEDCLLIAVLLTGTGNSSLRELALIPGTYGIGEITPPTATPGSPVTFSAGLAFPDPQGDQWSWNFGASAEPATSSDASPTASFSQPGVYACSVELSNRYGNYRREFAVTVLSTTGSGNWSSPGGNPQNSSGSPYLGPAVPHLQWERGFPDLIHKSVCTGPNGTIYGITADERLLAFDRLGEVSWQVQLGSGEASIPVIDDNGNISVICGGTLFHVSESGNILWQMEFERNLRRFLGLSPGGTIFVTDFSDTLHAIDGSGQILWKLEDFELQTGIIPAFTSDGTMYCATRSGFQNLLAAVTPSGSVRWLGIDNVREIVVTPADTLVCSRSRQLLSIAGSGNILWTLEFPGGQGHYPTVSVGQDGRIYTAVQGDLLILDENGTETARGHYDNINVPPVVDAAGNAYIATIDGILAFNDEAEVFWQYRPVGGCSSVVLGNPGTLYMTTFQGLLQAIGPPSGRPIRGNMFGQDPAHGGFSRIAGPAVQIPPRSVELPDSSQAAVTISEDLVSYVGSRDGSMNAIDSDGTAIWRYVTEGSISSTAAITGDGLVIFGSDDGHVYAVDADGTLRWKYLTGGAVRSSALLDVRGGICIGSLDGKMYRLNREGELLWTHQTAGGIVSSAAQSADGNVLFGSRDGKLHCVSADGIPVWEYPTGDWVDASASVSSSGRIFFGSWDGNLYALEADGSLAWSYQTHAPVTATPAIAFEQYVLVGSQSDWFYVFDMAGSLEWKRLLGGNVQSQALVDVEGTAFIGDSSGRLYSFDINANRILWSQDLQSGALSGSCLDPFGQLRVLGSDGLLITIPKWTGEQSL